MHVTLASMDISLDQLPPALSWQTSSDGIESDMMDIKNGITLAFRFSFDQNHPNKFVKAMAQRLGSTGLYAIEMPISIFSLRFLRLQSL
jgi:hypothetical protein